MTDLDVANLAAFAAAARERGIGRVVVAWQDEWTQAPDQAAVDYRRVRRATVLGYAAGGLVRLVLDGDAAERTALADALTRDGFAVELRSRNLGASERTR